jgi:hypothetical protein
MKCSGQIRVASLALQYPLLLFVYTYHLTGYEHYQDKCGLDIGLRDNVGFETCNGTIKLKIIAFSEFYCTHTPSQRL